MEITHSRDWKSQAKGNQSTGFTGALATSKKIILISFYKQIRAIYKPLPSTCEFQQDLKQDFDIFTTVHINFSVFT